MRLLVCAMIGILGGCAEPLVDVVDVDESFILRRAYVHPATRLGEWSADKGFGQNLDDTFQTVGCQSAAGSLVMHLAARVEDGRGLGSVEILFGTPTGGGDVCDGTGSVFIQALSYREFPADPLVPQLSGPAFIEGRRLDGRINLGDFSLAAVNLGRLPRWWSVRADVEGNRLTPHAGVAERLRLTNAEARAVWSARALTLQNVGGVLADGRIDYPVGTVALWALVQDGYQPGVDLDGDGLERIELAPESTAEIPGPVLRCIDGDETVIEGADCTEDPRIVDGYEVVLVFRLEPVLVVDN